MIVPHLAAIYCARQRLPLWAGVYAGIAFLVNTKAVFVLAVCAIWLWPEWLMVAVWICGACVGRHSLGDALTSAGRATSSKFGGGA